MNIQEQALYFKNLDSVLKVVEDGSAIVKSKITMIKDFTKDIPKNPDEETIKYFTSICNRSKKDLVNLQNNYKQLTFYINTYLDTNDTEHFDKAKEYLKDIREYDMSFYQE